MAKVRNILVTKNNPEIPAEDYLRLLFETTGAVYCCGQLEKAPTTGTLHIQAFLNFKEPQRFSKIHKYDKLAACKEVKINHGAHDYCMKEDSRVEGPWEFGKKPMQRASKVDWKAIVDSAKKGDIAAIPEDIQVRYYGNLQKMAKDSIQIGETRTMKALWIYGSAGLGKSYLANQLVTGDFYPKARNKWWDGYAGQKTVILNDMDKYNKDLGGDLKDWADIYPIIVQNKGSAVTAQWTELYVTSQYSITEIFGEDQKTVDALQRRFTEVYVDDDLDPFGRNIVSYRWAKKPETPKLDIENIKNTINKYYN